MFRNLKISLFVFVILISSCYKDRIITDNTDITGKTYPPIDVNAKIVGRVHDESGKDIIDYSCAFMGDVYYAANSPYYYFNASDANKNGTLLTINSGIDKYQFTVKPVGNDINYFAHCIISAPLIFENNSKMDFDAKLGNNVSFYINSDSYLNNGEKYNGNVIIKAFVPDLKNPDHLEALPGGHIAIDKDSNTVWLNYFYAAFLQIKNEKDNVLEIRRGNSGISFTGEECRDCQVWRYSNEKHIWQYYSEIDSDDKQDFYITKQGFYTIAKPYIFNLVEGEILAGNTPLIHQPVDIYFEKRIVDRVYTTNSGKWFTHLPLGKSFSYKVDIVCNKKFEENFNLGEDDVKLDALVLDKNELEFVKIKGIVRDCSNREIENSFFNINDGELSEVYFFNSPLIDIYIPSCGKNTINISSSDENWENTGPTVSYDASSGIIDFENLYSCNQIKQDGYFNISINGDNKLFRTTESKWDKGQTQLLVYDEKNIKMELSLLFSGKEAREYSDNEINIYFENMIIENTIYEMNCSENATGCGFRKFIIDYFGNEKDDWIKGSFEAVFWLKTYNPLAAGYKNVKADFLVKRNFK